MSTMKVMIIVCRMLFVVVGVWGVGDVGCGSLVDLIEETGVVSSVGAAGIVSLMVGIFGAISLFSTKKQ